MVEATYSSLRFKFDDFEKLPTQPGELASSDEVTDSHGNTWTLDIYPGGQTEPENKEEQESDFTIFLFNRGERIVEGKMSIIMRDANGRAHCQDCGDDVDEFVPATADSEEERGFGLDLPIKRSEIIDKANNVLIKGALVIDAELQMINKRNEHRPSNPHVTNMLALLDSGDESDISFKIGEEIMHAHKLILKTNVPQLFDFCEKHDGESSPIPIDDTSKDVFRIVLQYAYGGHTPEANTLKAMGKDVIEAANRYGVIDLKLAVETALVELLVITVQNVMDYLLFADAKTCPLLKEYAVSFFVARASDLLTSTESKRKLRDAPELMEELMIAVTKDREMYKERSKVGKAMVRDRNQVLFHRPAMRVGELRRRLDEGGLDVDGSKEILVSRLEGSNKRRKT